MEKVEAMKRIAHVGFGFVLSLGLLGMQAAAQNQPQSKPKDDSASGSSLGDYARHVRKDTGQAKAKPKVFDNDTLPREDKLSIVGTKAPEENATQAKTDEANAASKPGVSGAATSATQGDEAQKQALWKQWQEKLASQKDQIELLQRELDV